MSQKAQLHSLVEALPEDQEEHAVRVLQFLTEHVDPLDLTLAAASDDDEPLTAADRFALQESQEELEHQPAMGHEEARRLLFG